MEPDTSRLKRRLRTYRIMFRWGEHRGMTSRTVQAYSAREAARIDPILNGEVLEVWELKLTSKPRPTGKLRQA